MKEKRIGKMGWVLFVTAVCVLWYKYNFSNPFAILLNGAFIVFCLLDYRISKEDISSLGFWKENLGRQIALGLCGAVILILIHICVALWTGKSFQISPDFQPKRIPSYLLISMVFTGLSQEIFWRGYFYDQFRKIFGSSNIAIALSTAVFAVGCYILNPNAANVIQTTLFGLSLCVARAKIKDCSVLSLAIAHGIYTFYGSIFTVIG